MARIIPNEQSYLGFVPTVANLAAPTTAEITAGKNLTAYLISLNASSTGNTVPTPDISTLFETSIPGTVQASLTADFYRDDTAGASGDLAWVTLPRKTSGYFVIQRFGLATPGSQPATAAKVEVWPIMVVSRTMSNMANNTAMTFTVTCSVPSVPNEAAVVAA
jgi:hypothetical protein